MRSIVAFSLAGVLMAACTADPDPVIAAQSTVEAETVQISWDELNEMIEAFGYEQGIRRFCEDPAATSQDDFLAEIEGMSAFNASLLERAKTRASEVQTEFDQADPQEEQEYICTVEMFAGSEDRANLARQKWTEVKDLGNE